MRKNMITSSGVKLNIIIPMDIAVFKWYPVDELEELDLSPVFLTEKLISLPKETEHIVNFENLD